MWKNIIYAPNNGHTFVWTLGVFIRGHIRDVFRISGISAQPFVPIIKRVQAARPSSIVWFVGILQYRPQWNSVKHIPKPRQRHIGVHFSGTRAKVNETKFQSGHRLSEKVCLRALCCVCCWTKRADDIVNKATLTTVKQRLQFELRGKHFNWDYTKRVHKNVKLLPTCWCESRLLNSECKQNSALS